MLRSRYIYRMDDVTPGMNWDGFWRYIDLFRRCGVKPLLGVVPDSRDPVLAVQESHPAFWQILRQLVAEGAVEVSQHGYQHLYETKRHGLLGRRYGFKAQSEFVGLPFEVQKRKIEAGQQILWREGLQTDVWMAPSHSFDRGTLKALVELGFLAVTDGIALYPYRRHGLMFVPQQLFRPKLLPLGVWTICLHINETRHGLFEEVEKHLRSGARLISFSEAREHISGLWDALGNTTFSLLYPMKGFAQRILDVIQ